MSSLVIGAGSVPWGETLLRPQFGWPGKSLASPRGPASRASVARGAAKAYHASMQIVGSGARKAETGMARSVNVILCCVALLAASLLAYVMTPHRLMARTHDVFNIDEHVPRSFGVWSPLPG